jgi:hypothetical protein
MPGSTGLSYTVVGEGSLAPAYVTATVSALVDIAQFFA